MKALKLQREQYVSNGKSYYAYFVKGIARNKEVKVSFTAPDRAGYQVLDIVFGDANEVDLKIVPFEMKGQDGSLITGNQYLASSIDSNGQVYECKVKPYQTSDKALINMLINND